MHERVRAGGSPARVSVVSRTTVRSPFGGISTTFHGPGWIVIPFRPPVACDPEHRMNYPIIPADAAVTAWQWLCCLASLAIALVSLTFGSR